MAYTGKVTIGGPSDVRELDALVIRKASVSDMDNNIYLLTCRGDGTQLLIDAADDPARIDALIQEGTGRLDALVTTHQHWDHVRALPDVVRRYAARGDLATAAGDQDADALPVRPDRQLAQDDTIEVGDCTLTAIRLRGHTPGSVALLYQDPGGSAHLFTGDSLFPGGPGKTSSPADFATLMDDLEQRVFGVLPDDTWVYPGHGADTTLGAERPHVSQWRARGW